MRLHFTGTFFSAPRWQSSDNQTPLGQWPRPSASKPQESNRRPGVEFPTSSFASSQARGHFHVAATTRLLSDLNPLYTHHTHAHTVLPDTERPKDQGEGEPLVRARRGENAPRSRPARHPPAGREPRGGGAGAPSSPKTSLKSSSSWAPQFAVVIGVAQGAVAPPQAAAAAAPQRRFMPGRAGQKIATPRQTFREGTATPSVRFRALVLAVRRAAPGAAATASSWCLSRHSHRRQHSPPRNSRRSRWRAPAPTRAPAPAPYCAPV